MHPKTTSAVHQQRKAATRVETKKDLVREYLAKVRIPERVDYEELYRLTVKRFKDWASEDKESVLRWLKQYVAQIEHEVAGTAPKAKNRKIQRVGNLLVDELREKMQLDTKGDEDAFFSLNRFIWVRLRKYEDDLKRTIKKQLCSDTGTVCSGCKTKYRSASKLDVHRENSHRAYSLSNCRLVCRDCHMKIHRKEMNDGR